jgi:hypothetical protein
LESLPNVPPVSRVAALLTAFAIPAFLTYPVWGEGSGPVYERVGRSIQDCGRTLAIAVLVYSLAYWAFARLWSGSIRTPTDLIRRNESTLGLDRTDSTIHS